MKPPPFPIPPRNILIIKPSAIGDIVHALPVLALVRRKWPQAKISWLASTACATLLDGHPDLNEVIRFDRRFFGEGWRNPLAAIGLLGFFRALRRRRFDLVIDLQGLFRSGMLAAASGAPVRIGPAEARELGWLFYTHRATTGFPLGHAVERNLAVAAALGLGRSPLEFRLATTASDRQRVDALIAPGERFAVFLPGTNWDTKRWPAQKFAALVRPLREQYGLASVVAGGAADGDLASQIPGSIDLTGKTNLRELVALLQRADLVIANDTGPMHIAAALGRPLVSIYGPTSPDRTGPFGRLDTVVQLEIECSPCFGRHCSHTSCMNQLEPLSILNMVREQLAPASPRRTTPLRVLRDDAANAQRVPAGIAG